MWLVCQTCYGEKIAAEYTCANGQTIALKDMSAARWNSECKHVWAHRKGVAGRFSFKARSREYTWGVGLKEIGVDVPRSKRRKLIAERAKAHLVAVEMAVREMSPKELMHVYKGFVMMQQAADQVEENRYVIPDIGEEVVQEWMRQFCDSLCKVGGMFTFFICRKETCLTVA